MRAIITNSYGGTEVIEYTQIPTPNIQSNEVLIEVCAASLNALDWRLMRGSPWFVRLSEGLWKPKNLVRGADVSGIVVGVGSQITKFKIGDEVFGDIGHGAFAQYAVAKEDQIICKPVEISHQCAASLPVAGETALQALQKANIKSGDKVLINGASGGVGNFAIQIAKALGGEVHAVVSSRNKNIAAQSGADIVYDYSKVSIIDVSEKFDIVIDVAVSQGLSDMLHLLNQGGCYIMVGFTSLTMLQIILGKGRWLHKENKKVEFLYAQHSSKDLQKLIHLVTEKKVMPYIDCFYNLGELPLAMKYFESKHAQGKIIVQVKV